MQIQIAAPPPLNLWTVYERLEPLQYVARLTLIDGCGVHHVERQMISSDLETIRDVLAARGLHPIPADPNDDPQIVELWL